MTNSGPIAYFDCFSGASGDMILGALVGAGWNGLEEALGRLPVSGWRPRIARVTKRGVAATKVDFDISKQTEHRDLAAMLEIIRSSELPDRVQSDACAIFERLAEVEARVHGRPIRDVHFHELGGMDTLLDIVGACAGFHSFNFGCVCLSPVAVGSGFVRTEHGLLPVPAPATVELLKGWTVVDGGIAKELTTPTGAAVLTHFASEQQLPPMVLQRVAYGAGSRELERPNVLRLMIGQPVAEAASGQVVVIETLIDDMNPELLPAAVEQLLEAGARDAFLVPVQAKKGRSAVLLTVLAAPGDEERLIEVLFRETTTIGVRFRTESRRVLVRHEETVETEYGSIRVKTTGEGDLRKSKPEFEDCRRAAREHGVPVRVVYQAVLGRL